MMDISARQAMLAGDSDKPKILSDNTVLEPDWLTKKYNMERKEMWWDRNSKARYDRNFCGLFVNIFYLFLLITEVVLWIKVFLSWRLTSTPGYSIAVIIPLLLPSLVLPSLSILHSLFRGRLSYTSACLLIVPPAPIALHFLIFYRKLQGEDHHRLSKAVRVAGFIQSLVTSLPLIIVSLVSLLKATVGAYDVDTSDMHRHLNYHSLQGLAVTVSLVNLVVTSLRFNERDSGRAVSLLVGFPFLFTNIGLRLIGFSFLFCYYDKVWLFLCLGLLFWICALSVLVSSMERMCGRLRRALGDNSSNSSLSQKTTLMDGTAGMLLLSLGNMFVPCGYATNSRGWRMLFVSWLGSLLVHGPVIYQAIMSHVPNTFQGLAPVDMGMIIPETGLKLDLPNVYGGLSVGVNLPRTKMVMTGDHPASFKINASYDQDLMLALLIPVLLGLLTVPFTLLRILLLGWNCTLTRQPFPDEDDDEDDLRLEKASKSRNCLAVCCGVSGMMMFTFNTVLVVFIYIVVVIMSFSKPLVRDPKT